MDMDNMNNNELDNTPVQKEPQQKEKITGSNKKYNAYKVKYAKEHYKRVPLDLDFDMLEQLDEHIKSTGEKRNAFIKRAIMECMENDFKKHNF